MKKSSNTRSQRSFAIGGLQTVVALGLAVSAAAVRANNPEIPSAATGAQSDPDAMPVTTTVQKAVVTALARELREKYIFPEVAKRAAVALTTKAARGGYDAATTNGAFSAALSADLKAMANDGHFLVRFNPKFRIQPNRGDVALTSQEVAEAQSETSRRAYGIQRVQRLPGNVAYMDVRAFGPTEFVAGAYTAAMSLVAGSDALIVDLRQNNGGNAQSVVELESHFFAEGEFRHLNDIYDGITKTTQSYWTNPAANIRYTKPIYVLTSRETFSGGEALAYDIKVQKRGTIVGDTTGGGSNPSTEAILTDGFVLHIPTAQSINPITKTNWEHVGVKPDIAVAAEVAMKTAYLAVLSELASKATDPRENAVLMRTKSRVEKDELQLPVYVPRR